MKKVYGLIAILAIGIGLAGCGDQKKAALEKNLASYGDKNSFEVSFSKYDVQNDGQDLTDKSSFNEGTKLNLKIDKKSKVMQIDTKMKVNNKEMNVDIIGNDSKMLMSTRSIAKQMQSILGDSDSVEMPNIDKLNSTYVDFSSSGSSLDLSSLNSLWSGTDNLKSGSKELLKDEKVTKTKDGYLKVTLYKKDVKNMLAKEKKADSEKTKKVINDYKKFKITLLSKGSKLIYKLKAETKANAKIDMVMNVKAKNEKINLKMPSDKQIITTTEMQKYLEPKLKS